MRLLRPKTTYVGRLVSDSVCSKHQMSFRNGYVSFSMAHRLKMIGSTSTQMKTGNPHRTFRGDKKRSGRQQIVSWQIIWLDNLGTFLAIVTSTFCITGERTYSNMIYLPISRHSSRHRSNSTNATRVKRSFHLICSMRDSEECMIMS